MNNMICLNYNSKTPIYEQIVSEIERHVALSKLKPGQQILSIREMAARLGINPNTVKKSYSILESKNVIQTISTKGTFIVDTTDNVINAKKESLYEKIEKNIKELETIGFKKANIKKELGKRNII